MCARCLMSVKKMELGRKGRDRLSRREGGSKGGREGGRVNA